MNVIHSIDAYILRSMQRRCNYDPVIVSVVRDILQEEEDYRYCDGPQYDPEDAVGPHAVYSELYNRTNMVDAVILPFINSYSVRQLELDHIQALIALCDSMLAHPPFELITVHDEFKCHANYCNYMRQHYIDIFAELADSNIIDDIFFQITGSHVSYANSNPGLSEMIRNSEYALS